MKINIIDNGSQYTHLIYRTIKNIKIDETINIELLKNNEKKEKQIDCDKIIFSGGPGSVTIKNNSICKNIVKDVVNEKLNLSVLGICLGHQIIASALNGKVANGNKAEYGIAKIKKIKQDKIFKGLPTYFNVWVSHFDEVKKLPNDFISIAKSQNCEIEAMRHINLPIFGTQFHPEVWHTENGEKIIENFLKYD